MPAAEEEERMTTAITTDDIFFIYTGNEEVPIDITHVRIHPSLTSIPDRAFLGRTNLQSIQFHQNLQSIGDYTFGDCTSLTKIKIPPGTSIGQYAFAGCTNLSDVELGEGVDTIGTMAFYRCTNLTNINIPPTSTTKTPQEEELDDVVGNANEGSSLQVTIIGDATDQIWKRSWKRNRMLLIVVASFVVVVAASVALIGVMFSSGSRGEISSPGVIVDAAGADMTNDTPVPPQSTSEAAITDDDSKQQQVVPAGPTNEDSNCIIVNVTLDEYPADTSWNIQDLNNGGSTTTTIIASSPPFNESMATTTIDGVQVCLSNGEYSFTIVDEWGDGICCNWGEGSYSVSTTSGLLIASGGEFERFEETVFSIPFGGEGPTDVKEQPQQPAPAASTTTTNTEATPVPATKQPSLAPTTKAPLKPSCTMIEIVITLDDYPLDTSWNIIDSTEKTVAESSPYEASMAQTTQVDQICLVDGAYSFVIFDAYEDGMCCNWGEGGYILRYPSGGGGGEIFVSGGGEWLGLSETTSFTITEGSASSSSSQAIPATPPQATTNKPTSNPTNPPSSPPPTPTPTTITTTITPTCTTLEISITLDNYPLDTSWTIFDDSTNENTLATSPPYNESMADSTQVTSTCLLPGSYTFVIYHVFEDGLCCGWGEGSYTLLVLGGDDNDVIVSGSEWVGANETKVFTIT